MVTALHPTVKALLIEIEDFRLRAGLNPTKFGQMALRDGNFIRSIQCGRTPSLNTIDRVRKFMRTYGRKAA